MDKMPDNIRGYAFQDDDDAPAPKPKVVVQQKVAPVTTASPNKFSSLGAEEEDEGEDDAAFSAPPAQQQQQSVLSAMMPQEEEEGEAEEVEPVKVPVKTTVTAKKIIKKVGGK